MAQPVPNHTHDSEVRGGLLKPERMMRDLAVNAQFTVNTQVGDEIAVDIVLADGEGVPITDGQHVSAYLSDSPVGDGVSATAPDGGVTEGQGKIIVEFTPSLAWWLMSEVGGGGQIQLEITHSLARTWHLVVVFGSGQQAVSPAITFA